MLTLQGPSRIRAGEDFTFLVNGCIDGLPDMDQILLVGSSLAGPDGLVLSSTVKLLGPHGVPCYATSGQSWYTIVAAPLWIKLRATSLPLGSGPCLLEVTFQASSSALRQQQIAGPTQALTATLSPSAYLPCSRSIPIPNLSAWESAMLTLGDKWAPQILDPANQLGENNWYYGLPSVFWQVCDYVGDERYAAAALASAKSYMSYLASTQPAGAVPGWCVFPAGLRQCWERTQDRQYLDAMLSLANSPWVATGGDPSPELIRETAYAAMFWMEYERAGNARDPRLLQSIDFLLADFDQLFLQEIGKSDNSIQCQPFWCGLAADALIDWYEMSEDERVIDALQIMTEYIRQHAVDPATGMVLYNIWKPQGDGNANAAYCGLNLLMVNAWGFLYRITGDESKRVQGDILFSHFNDDPGGGISWSSKMYGQNFWRSFKYVRWRR